MVKDSIANLIIKLKNGGIAGKSTLEVSYSKLTEAILTLLMREGYIKSFKKDGSLSTGQGGNKIIKTIDVELAYEDGKSKIEGVERVSKLSRRTYSGAKSLRSVRSGYGIQVLSTPKGILSGGEAKKQNVGGELLFKIW